MEYKARIPQRECKLRHIFTFIRFLRRPAAVSALNITLKKKNSPADKFNFSS